MTATAEDDRIARIVVDAAFRVHSTLGPGLMETVYEQCLVHEFGKRGMPVRRQVSLPIVYNDLRIDNAFRIDLLVADTLIVEVKATEQHHPLFEAQLLTYLRLSGKRLGLLMNFNVPRIKDGIRRLVI